MSQFASLARRCATGLIAAQLVFGAVSVTALTAAAPAQAATYLDYSLIPAGSGGIDAGLGFDSCLAR